MKWVCLFILFFYCQFGINQDELQNLYYPAIELGDLPYEFATQVHSLGDFIKRFNGEHNGVGRPFDKNSSTYKKIKSDKKRWESFRKKVIATLFDRSFMEENIDVSVEYASKLSSFDKLSLSTSYILSSVQFLTIYNCRLLNGSIILKYEGSEKRGYSWMIHNVIFEDPEKFGKIEEVCPVAQNTLFIPPNAHNNNFVFMHKIVNERHDLSPYILSSTEGVSYFQFIMSTEDFSIDFGETKFIFKLTDSEGFVLNKRFNIISDNITQYIN